ncbi:hypothetical protein K469DRAFT_620432 [Zopfia rhizophila CBS 207.26]|uniref:Mitochondrial outer membrane transport complex Sam37/metaxin N-terminal domain-containing protein n=1 Tax=Zopfia rhizophila CBS 207.26 TaxID=1314779 RepID=A0A6A6EQE4_9PEZI|nr:hypothetical protein K469DRAFT_620432 [Zopfia rhizophila CBS 207.26]
MVLELHVWGPAFGLPSIDAECIATIAYFHRIIPYSQWILVADHDAPLTPKYEFPVLIDGIVRVSGFHDIVSYLRNHRSGAYDLDYNLTHQQQTDRTAFISFLQSTASPLVDLSLYISSENYTSTTSSAYTAILPWYTNYTIPPARRDLARARTAHLGLSSLDVNTAGQDGPEVSSPSSGFEAAKRSAGLPSGGRLDMGRGKGIRGLLSSPIYAARFRLDSLTNELLEPLSDLLGKKDYLLQGDKPSSLDCLAFGYLALMFYPPVPQAWLKDAIQARYPRIVRYIWRMREELLGGEDVKASGVWSLSSYRKAAEIEEVLHNLGMCLPWRPCPSRSLLLIAVGVTRKITSNIPLLSRLLHSSRIVYPSPSGTKKGPSALPSPLIVNSFSAISAAIFTTFAAIAIHHRRSPREGDLIFWALRPSTGFGGYGEAGNILSILAGQFPRGATRY